MTSTSSLQHGPDYFDSQDECLAFEKARKRKPGEKPHEHDARTRTNPRHKGFGQSIFHVGDPEQFQQFRNESNGDPCPKEINLSHNLFHKALTSYWSGYNSVPATACKNTFNYIFNKFKKGIFVQIRNNKLTVFLPFSKSKFRNEYGDKIKIDPKYNGIHGFLRHIQNMDNEERRKTAPDARVYNYNPKSVHEDTSNWYANNCLFRYESPINEGDSNVLNVQNMLTELCEERIVPDIEFFMNRRDFPLLTTDGTEAYDAIYGSENHPLVSHSYEKYLPILSMSKTDRYADVVVPTHEDWARVQSQNGKWLPPCRAYDDDFSTPWDERQPTAVFRGKSTGCGVTIDSNPRLKLAYLSSVTSPDPDGVPYLDAGITSWQLRPRKLPNNPYLQTIEPSSLPFGLAPFMSPSEQATYKYIINVDGHVSAFRLPYELSMGSVLLIVGSKWRIWCSNLLKPYVHFVPVKEDMSDLVTQIKWCREHDDECEKIAQNARDFYNTYLQRDGILDFIQHTLVNLKKQMGVYLYNVSTPLEAQLQAEGMAINNLWVPSHSTKGPNDVVRAPPGRTYGVLQGLQWVVNMLSSQNAFERVATKGPVIFENKSGTVTKYKLARKDVVVKSSNISDKIKEHIHEAYICVKEVNELAKRIPNVAYVLGHFRGKDNSFNLVSEYIPGSTLDKYIDSESFKFQEFLLILLQLCLALEVAQNTCAFVHWDLVPWNIVIVHLPKERTIDYLLSHNRIYQVKTSAIPVMIDFGKSHVIHNNQHHGFVEMFRTSTIQDVVTLVSRSIASMGMLPKEDFTGMFRLAEFLIGQNHGLNARGLRERMTSMARFQDTLGGWGHLERLGPMDLFSHIRKMNYVFPISTTDKYISSMDQDNARQVYDFTMSSTDEERMNSYVNVFERGCVLPQPDNLFFTYYVAQTIWLNMQSVHKGAIAFAKKAGISPDHCNNAYNNVVDSLSSTYERVLQDGHLGYVHYNMGDFSELIHPKYTPDTFLLPSAIAKMLGPSDGINLNMFKEIVELVLSNWGKYKLHGSHMNHYTKVFEKLLDVKGVNMVNNTATQPTLHLLAKRLYQEDLNVLMSKVERCADTERFIGEYEKVLDDL